MGRYSVVTKGPTYPLYIDINYDRKFTKFPYGVKWYSVKEYEELLKDNFIIESNLQAIKKIVRHEAERDPDFTLKGFAKKVKSYLSSFNEAGYLAGAHYALEHLRKKVPHDDYVVLLDTSPINQIKEGLKRLDAEHLTKLKQMAGVAQMISQVWVDGLILTWLTNYTVLEKANYVKEGLKSINEHNLYGLDIFFEKSINPEVAVSEIDHLAYYVIDNELFVDMRYITDEPTQEWNAKQ